MGGPWIELPTLCRGSSSACDKTHYFALFESGFSHFRRGTLTTHLVSFKNAIKFVMALPGKNAKEALADFAHVLLQFIAGDSQLKADIDKNAESSNLLNILAREAIRIESSEAVPSDRQFGL